jgi:hypothetical protein
MIFKTNHLLGIKSGKITLAFRKWEKPGVKPGSTMRNEMGVIEVEDVNQVTLAAITEADAVSSGYDTRDELIKALNKVEKGKIFRIRLKYQSADPRIQLREQGSLTDEEFEKLRKRLARLDQAEGGPWTMKYLKLIQKYPERRAGDLADMIKMERLAFKLNVRKLKNLGLTISHEVGYSVSPLGEWVMRRLG